jgi:hypothetical protein
VRHGELQIWDPSGVGMYYIGLQLAIAGARLASPPRRWIKSECGTCMTPEHCA